MMAFLSKRQKGAVGIGTLIIFIAMVLVAAVAAAVLLNVSGILHQRSMETGKQTIQTVASNINVVYIVGLTDANYTNIYHLFIIINAAAGSKEIDLGQMVLRIGNGVNETVQRYAPGGMNQANGTHFTATEIRDPNNLFTPETPVIDGSSLIRLNVNVSSPTTYVGLPVRNTLIIILIPEFGNIVRIEVTTPPTYSSSQIDLYP